MARRRRNFIQQGTYLRDRLAAMDAPGDPSYAGPFVTKSGAPYPSGGTRRRRVRRRRKSMARRRGRFVSRRRRVVRRRRPVARRRRVSRRRVAVSGRRTLTGRVHVRRRTFTLRRRSKFKRRLRGFRINPHVAEYLMNPRRRRRGGRRYRSNPGRGVLGAMRGVLDMRSIQNGAVATGGVLSTVVVGNLVMSYAAPYIPAQLQTGYIGVVAKAAIRAATAWGLDSYVVPMITRDRSAFRVGAAIGIFGSAILELIGKSLVIGVGDQAQTPGQFIPTTLGAYVPRAMVSAYTRRSALAGPPAGAASTVAGLSHIGSAAHARIYNR